MEPLVIDKNIRFGKMLVWVNAFSLGRVVLKVVEVVMSEGGAIAFAKINIIGQTVLVIFNFIYIKKLKKAGKRNIATTLLVFALIEILLICFYIFLIIVDYMYPNM